MADETKRLVRMFQTISQAMDADRDRLSELDGAIGDADHGITMALGFKAVNAALAKVDQSRAKPSEIFALAASAFLDAVGASTGPLYATAFQSAAQALTTKERLDHAGITDVLSAFAAGIRRRGKGQRGDKTMLDAWIPAAEAAAGAVEAREPDERFWPSVIAAAEAGADQTRSMIATKGRAARVGERSLGHVDPGAASAVVIIRAMAETLPA